jgi:hypothetical protein
MHCCHRIILATAFFVACTRPIGANAQSTDEAAHEAGTYGPREVRTVARTYGASGLPALTPAELKVISARCLVISSTKVVDDARAIGLGPWSFGQLITEVANEPATGIDPKQMVESLFKSVGGEFETKGSAAWDALSSRQRTLDKLPFRLLAIVNRIDLRKNLVLGGSGAGELRFVYGLLDAGGKPFDSTVIFEFAVKRSSFNEVLAWGRQWYQLRLIDIGRPEFNPSLQQITDQYTLAGADAEALPNRSALAQLRVSVGGKNSKSWTFSEFRIDVQNTGQLVRVTTKQTPDLSFDGTNTINDYLNSAQIAILNDRHQVPVMFQGQKFLGDQSNLPNQRPPKFFWKGAMLPASMLEARHRFSLNTCNGCHARETDTDFFHITNRDAGAEAGLSKFLTEIEVVDPAGQTEAGNPMQPKKRKFHDLLLRAEDLRALVEIGLPYELTRQPLNAVH